MHAFMKDLFKYTKSDIIIKWSMILTIFLILANLIGISIIFFSLPPFIPLYNQLPWGNDRLGHNFEIFLPILIISFLSFGNLLLINTFYEKSPLIVQVLAVTTFMLSVLTTIFIFQTIQLIR